MLLAVLFSLVLIMGECGRIPGCFELNLSYSLFCRTFSCPGVKLMISEAKKEAQIKCSSNSLLDCSKLQDFNLGRNKPIKLLTIDNCALNSSVQCLLKRLNATDSETVLFKNVRTPVTKETVEGLHVTDSLYVLRSENHSVPIEAINSLPNLKMLRLYELGLTYLSPNSYTDVKALRYLDISKNNISRLSADSFRGLNLLEELVLDDNNIQHLDVNVFRGLDSLQKLSLKGNSMRTLPVGVFQHTPQLTNLEITYNLVELTLTAGVLTDLQNMEKLSFQCCDVLVLDSKAMSYLPALRSLDLGYCNITDLPENLLEGSTAVVNLTLNDNSISNIPENIFQNMDALENLILTNNNISTVTKAHFNALTSIKTINLDGNIIGNLTNDLFSSLLNLRNVSMSNNIIRGIDESAFHGAFIHNLDLSNNQLDWECSHDVVSDISPLKKLSYIRHLDLSHNRIKGICADWTQEFRSLQYLNLSSNQLEGIQTGDMNFMSSNVTVNLRNNRISSVKLNNITDQPILLLGNNPFNCDCHLHDFLQKLHKLPYIIENATCSTPESMKNITLDSIADGKPNSPVSLDMLICQLTGNSSDCDCISRPQKNRTECYCKDTLNLRELALSGFSETLLKLGSKLSVKNLPEYVRILNMSNLELDTFPDFPKTVKHVDLSHNRLSKFPLEILSRSNLTLELRNNSFLCDCDNADEIAKIQKVRKRNEVMITDYERLFCTDGSSLEGVDTPRLCYMINATTISVSVICTSIVLLIAGITIFKYFLEIKVFLYNHGWTWLVEADMLDTDKIYDIFISFSNEDVKYVTDVLLPVLDKEYKVCYHIRDWDIGDVIIDQIYRSVTQSKRTLIVFSKAFLQSKWALEEFRAAHKQAIIDKRPRIVAILLDNVDYKTAPDLIKNYLGLATYIQYEDSMFWQRLRYALPRKMTAADIKKWKTTELARKNLSEGGINIILDEDGNIVNKLDKVTTDMKSEETDKKQTNTPALKNEPNDVNMPLKDEKKKTDEQIPMGILKLPDKISIEDTNNHLMPQNILPLDDWNVVKEVDKIGKVKQKCIEIAV